MCECPSIDNRSPRSLLFVYNSILLYHQTKFGRLFLKKTGSVEEVLVELTEEQLIVRSHDRRAPPIEETPIQEVCHKPLHPLVSCGR